MKINQLTQVQMRHFFASIQSRFDCEFININTEKGRYLAGKVNDVLKRVEESGFAKLMGLPKINADLRPMCVNNIVLLTFEPATQSRSQLSQINVVTHELSHKISIDEYGRGFFKWIKNYYLDFGFRALEETRAREAEQEFNHWYSGMRIRLDLDHGYALQSGDLTLAENAYKAHWDRIKDQRGRCLNAASHSVVQTLKGLGVEAL